MSVTYCGQELHSRRLNINYTQLQFVSAYDYQIYSSENTDNRRAEKKKCKTEKWKLMQSVLIVYAKYYEHKFMFHETTVLKTLIVTNSHICIHSMAA